MAPRAGLTVTRDGAGTDGEMRETPSVAEIRAIPARVHAADALTDGKKLAPPILVSVRRVAAPLLILAAQTVLVALWATYVVFNIVGRDYESGIIAGAFCGFAMGATATAIANMQALTRRHGPAPEVPRTVSVRVTHCVSLGEAQLDKTLDRLSAGQRCAPWLSITVLVDDAVELGHPLFCASLSCDHGVVGPLLLTWYPRHGRRGTELRVASRPRREWRAC